MTLAIAMLNGPFHGAIDATTPTDSLMIAAAHDCVCLTSLTRSACVTRRK